MQPLFSRSASISIDLSQTSFERLRELLASSSGYSKWASWQRGGISGEEKIGELLFRAPGSDVRFVCLPKQPESRPQFGGEGGRIVAGHRESAATPRPVDGECGDDGVAIGGQRARQCLHVLSAVSLVRQEVEHGAVMPERESVQRAELGDIGIEPFDRARAHTQALPGLLKRRRGNVQDGQPLKAGVQEKIDEHRRAPAHVNDAPVSAHTALTDEPERGRGPSLIPAHIIGRLGLIDLVPVLFAIHGFNSASARNDSLGEVIHMRPLQRSLICVKAGCSCGRSA